MVLFKAVLSTYEGLGAIYVPPVLNKYILITDTGLDIVCGPQGELCACYHNGLPLDDAQTEVSDLDFISCWLAEEDTLSRASEVSEEIWIFGALCLYWCDVELHMYPILISGDSFWEGRFLI